MSVRGSNSRNNAGGVVTHQVLPNQHLFIVHLWFCFGFLQPGEQHTKTTTISTQNCKKIFIQRDYSEGCNVKFMTRFPAELQVPKFYFSTLELLSTAWNIFRTKLSVSSLSIRSRWWIRCMPKQEKPTALRSARAWWPVSLPTSFTSAQKPITRSASKTSLDLSSNRTNRY